VATCRGSLHTVRCVIEPASGVPLHRQVAAALRARIASGEWPPGTKLPSETYLRQEYDVGRGTIRQAIAALRAEGLLEVQHGFGTRVRTPGRRHELEGPSGATVEVRMPTPEERVELRLTEGVPVLVVTSPDGWVDVYPGDQYRLRIP
jgi:DNA-binding FadR family transcriptional regulator